MNRFAKRSMVRRINVPWERKTEMPLIALHKVIVTVRQMFSDEPAMKNRAISHCFGGAPFLFRRLHGLAEKY